MFKIHMTCKHCLIIKPFRILVYQPGGALQKWLLVTIWAIVFVYCDVFRKNLTAQLENPPSRHSGYYGPSFMRNNTPRKCYCKNSSWSMIGHMAYDDAKLRKIMICACDKNFCQHVLQENPATRMFKIHMTCRYGLVVKPLRALFYQPVVLRKKAQRLTIWVNFLVYCDFVGV